VYSPCGKFSYEIQRSPHPSGGKSSPKKFPTKIPPGNFSSRVKSPHVSSQRKIKTGKKNEEKKEF